MSAWIVTDLGFGDAGKGTITDFLVRELGARTVVRWNGGAQAGHTVVTDDGRTHTFSQFGAGTFVPGVRTHLAEAVVVHPTALLVEARHLARCDVGDALARLTIDERARLITPFHQAANRARESARGPARHGSCGVGFGEAVRESLAHDVPRARDLRDARALRAKVEDARARLWSSLAAERDLLGDDHPELAPLADRDLCARWVDAATTLHDHVVDADALGAMLRDGSAVLEGAQGVLLDERYGFHPHTTWSNCTPRAATALLSSHGYGGEVTRLGVLRTYVTRHGEGPLPTEHAALSARLPEPHNSSACWQGRFRAGHPDLVLARYALRASGGVDALAITHVDREPAIDTIATRYWRAGDASLFVHDEHGDVIDLRDGDLDHQARLARALRNVEPLLEPPDAPIAERLAHELAVPLAITSSGPTAAAKRWARAPRAGPMASK